MKVKELIRMLQVCDQELEVYLDFKPASIIAKEGHFYTQIEYSNVAMSLDREVRHISYNIEKTIAESEAAIAGFDKRKKYERQRMERNLERLKEAKKIVYLKLNYENKGFNK